MSDFEYGALALTAVALFGWFNARALKLPEPLGITVVGLIVALALVVAGQFEPRLARRAEQFIDAADFSELVLHGMLPLLLFAGTLHVDLDALRRERLAIGLLASLAVVLSTLAVGFGLNGLLGLAGLEVPLLVCLLFGAAISPTDPIAVLGVLRKAGAAPAIRAKVAGESLFNDAVAMVLFLTLLAMLSGRSHLSTLSVLQLLAQEVVGGVVVGLAMGALFAWLLRGIDAYAVEILLSLACALATYALAERLHSSAPLAVVAAALVVAARAPHDMSETTRTHLMGSWQLAEELMNLTLFAAVGVQALGLGLGKRELLVGLAAIPVVLAARALSVGMVLGLLSPLKAPSPGALPVLTWGGLRGGVSIALALSLPAKMPHAQLLAGATYVVVLFSLLVQGPTLHRVVEATARPAPLPRRTKSA